MKSSDSHTWITHQYWRYAFASPIVFSVVVVILGLITPGYSQIRYTVSRLAIEKYGWIQNLNFLQLALGFFFAGNVFYGSMSHPGGKRIWAMVMWVAAVMLILVALFPTDPIENARFAINLLTWHGVIHFATLGLFFLMTPFGIEQMKKSLKEEPKLADFAAFTAVIGYLVWLSCIVWVVLFFIQTWLPYRGIFQKGIIALCILWFLRLLWAVRLFPAKIAKYTFPFTRGV